MTGTGYGAFLADVLAQTTQPIFLVQDGARYHTSHEVQTWLAGQAERITVYQLPSYSPDYNPLEQIWRYVKAGTHNAYFPVFEALVARVRERLANWTLIRPRCAN